MKAEDHEAVGFDWPSRRLRPAARAPGEGLGMLMFLTRHGRVALEAQEGGRGAARMIKPRNSSPLVLIYS